VVKVPPTAYGTSCSPARPVTGQGLVIRIPVYATQPAGIATRAGEGRDLLSGSGSGAETVVSSQIDGSADINVSLRQEVHGTVHLDFGDLQDAVLGDGDGGEVENVIALRINHHRFRVQVSHARSGNVQCPI
jgi:hypothetical protein